MPEMLEIGTLAGSKYNDAGALMAQVVLHGAGASCTPGLAYSPFGFKGRPRSGVTDKDGNYTDGAAALYYYEGNTLHVIPLDDGRRSTKLPQLDEGGSIFYADVVDQSGNQVDAYAKFDASGNLKVILPDNAKMQVGDDPVPLGLGSAIKAILDAASTATPGNQEPGFLAFKQALALILDYQTNTFEAT